MDGQLTLSSLKKFLPGKGRVTDDGTRRRSIRTFFRRPLLLRHWFFSHRREWVLVTVLSLKCLRTNLNFLPPPPLLMLVLAPPLLLHWVSR